MLILFRHLFIFERVMNLFTTEDTENAEFLDF